MLKVVYVLCCNDSNYYPEQCQMTLHSPKKHNSDIPAYGLTDNLTNNCLKGKRLNALASYAEVLTFDVPEKYNPEKRRSCYLNTSVRNLIHGDIIFLDCDTLVCRTFSFETFNDVVTSMVADLNGALILSDENTLRKCQNAGFLFFRACPISIAVSSLSRTPLLRINSLMYGIRYGTNLF